ncbi:hypothetical protein GCM10010172_59750 [Paractinoplanes ferrugineus]|uniref:Anthranilate phosphoribosyltransferase n=1 Tax=Paractinoplanes ferrugineus TaxID=113564 RepID=A0A919J6W8_9ACTN|nr:hypothetical protein Afe05nite_62770 [Actinoplanes ferrugineus]
MRGEELAGEDTAWAMGEIMAGNASPVQIAGFAIALRAKGETPAGLTGLVEAMPADATPVELAEKTRTDAVDVVGTGGDRATTVNISTMAAIVTAAATRVWEASNGAVEELVLDSVELGLPRSRPADLRGDDVAFNAPGGAPHVRRRQGPGARRRGSQRGGGARGLPGRPERHAAGRNGPCPGHLSPPVPRRRNVPLGGRAQTAEAAE